MSGTLRSFYDIAGEIARYVDVVDVVVVEELDKR